MAGWTFLRINDADDVVDILFVNRNTGIAFLDCKRDDIHNSSGVFNRSNVGTMGHNVFGSNIVKLKDIVDHVGLIFFDGTFFVADIDHHADLFFRNLFRLILCVNAEKLENQVCAGRKDCNKRFGNQKNQFDNWSYHQGNSFWMVHCDSFWNQLTKYQADIA